VLRKEGGGERERKKIPGFREGKRERETERERERERESERERVPWVLRD